MYRASVSRLEVFALYCEPIMGKNNLHWRLIVRGSRASRAKTQPYHEHVSIASTQTERVHFFCSMLNASKLRSQYISSDYPLEYIKLVRSGWAFLCNLIIVYLKNLNVDVKTLAAFGFSLLICHLCSSKCKYIYLTPVSLWYIFCFP